MTVINVALVQTELHWEQAGLNRQLLGKQIELEMLFYS